MLKENLRACRKHYEYLAGKCVVVGRPVERWGSGSAAPQREHPAIPPVPRLCPVELIHGRRAEQPTPPPRTTRIGQPTAHPSLTL